MSSFFRNCQDEHKHAILKYIPYHQFKNKCISDSTNYPISKLASSNKDVFFFSNINCLQCVASTTKWWYSEGPLLQHGYNLVAMCCYYHKVGSRHHLKMTLWKTGWRQICDFGTVFFIQMPIAIWRSENDTYNLDFRSDFWRNLDLSYHLLFKHGHSIV